MDKMIVKSVTNAFRPVVVLLPVPNSELNKSNPMVTNAFRPVVVLLPSNGRLEAKAP